MPDLNHARFALNPTNGMVKLKDYFESVTSKRDVREYVKRACAYPRVVEVMEHLQARGMAQETIYHKGINKHHGPEVCLEVFFYMADVQDHLDIFEAIRSSKAEVS